MTDNEQMEEDWNYLIARIKHLGAGKYGTKHFMCQRHEDWKFLWADERILTLEAQKAALEQKTRRLEIERELMAKCIVEATRNTTYPDNHPMIHVIKWALKAIS